MGLSDEQIEILAKAIANGGKISASNIRKVYSSGESARGAIKKLQGKNYLVRNHDDPPGTFRVPIKDITDDGDAVFHAPQKAIAVAQNMKERSKIREKDEKYREKLG